MKTLLIAWLACAGCMAETYVKPIASLPVPAPTRAAVASPHVVAIGPFVDGRGDEFGRKRRSPFALLFHRSSQLDYPEAAGVLRGHDHGAFFTVGSLDGAMPVLVARTVQQLGLPTQVALDPTGADYFVTGRLVRSTLRRDSIPLAAALAPLGVPFKVARYDFAYEVALYDVRAPLHPLYVRTYQFRDKRVGGLYYNRDAPYALFVDGLEATLKQAAQDIAQAIAAVDARDAARPTG
jgi:hypothetical protein